ncbi:MAG: hypothetical protein HY898_14590 [Deltaproteobacteria bacterium]|nr:hypothetical protein [Deltaproteobacteria bacterium]
MMNFIREGGFPMFAILIFGAILLVACGSFAWRPDPRRVETIRALSKVLVFSTLTGVASDISAVMHHVPGNPEWAHSPELHLIVMVGLGESMAPAILGTAFLTVAWLIMALGFRRLARQM